MGKWIRDNKPKQTGTGPESLSNLSKPENTAEGTHCPKCDYLRKPSDTAPDWQCPHCKVAYYKVSAEYEAEQLQAAKDYAKQRVSEAKARRQGKRNSDVAAFFMFLGLIITTTCFTCGCGPTPTPSLWLLGGGIASLLGGFVFWLGSKVSRLHNQDKNPEKS